MRSVTLETDVAAETSVVYENERLKCCCLITAAETTLYLQDKRSREAWRIANYAQGEMNFYAKTTDSYCYVFAFSLSADETAGEILCIDLQSLQVEKQRYTRFCAADDKVEFYLNVEKGQESPQLHLLSYEDKEVKVVDIVMPYSDREPQCILCDSRLLWSDHGELYLFDYQEGILSAAGLR